MKKRKSLFSLSILSSISLLFVLILSISSVQGATHTDWTKHERERIKVDNIVLVNPEIQAGDDLEVDVTAKNKESFLLDNVKITIFVPELDIWAFQGPFKLKDKESRRVSLQIPQDTRPGEYFVKITVSNGFITRTKYRAFTVN